MSLDIQAKKTKSGKLTLSLKGGVTIYSVNELHNSLVKELAEAKELVLDLSKVDKIDTAGFQMILQAKRESGKKNIKFSCSSISKEAKDLFDLYGEKL